MGVLTSEENVDMLTRGRQRLLIFLWAYISGFFYIVWQR